MLPAFEISARLRPVALVAEGGETFRSAVGQAAAHRASYPIAVRAPYAAITAELEGAPVDGRLALQLTGAGGVRLEGWYDAFRHRLWLEVTDGRGTTRHRSRRHGRPATPVTALGLTLTGTHLTVFSSDGEAWTARGRVDLSDRLDTRDETFLASLGAGHVWHPGETSGAAPLRQVVTGAFGQLGFRDVRFVTERDGRPVRDSGRFLLTATHAGPGFFDTGHTGVWSLDPESLELRHRADLFFRRPDRPGVYGDHATHLLRDGDRWLVATSTWGDFDRSRPGATVAVTLAESRADLLHGTHVLDTRELPLPTHDLDRCVGVWDPHLVHRDGHWHVAFVVARRFFRFYPAVASGVDLDDLTLRGADPSRVATEGVTLTEIGTRLRLLASDGRDGRRGQRRRFGIFDLSLRQLGHLQAPYPTNIPWPTITPYDDGWLWVTFDGTAHGGPLIGYGSHGDLLVGRSLGDA